MEKKNKNGLKIIIVGCGKVGVAITERLCYEGHDITIIDSDYKKVQATADLYDVMGIVGNGASYNVQMDAGIENADLFIAVTGSDELNLLCCTIAKQVGDCAAIARVRTPDYSKEANYLREKLGLAMIINPDLEAAREIARILSIPTALEVETFAHGQAELVKFVIPQGNILNGMTISDLSKEVMNDVLIGCIERTGEVYIPSGAFRLEAGDIVSFVSTRIAAKKFLQKIGFDTHQVRDTMIVGGGNSGFYLAKLLINSGISVKIIEKDQERCEELSELLPRAMIINGDGTVEDLLREEGISDVDSFVPLTKLDEENIILTLFANSASDAKVVTKIDRVNFKDVINKLGLGSVVYPKYITSEAIIAYVRAKKASRGSNVETLYHMFDNRVEAIEFFIKGPSEVTDIPLMDLDLKDNLLIAFINRSGSIIIPSGQDCIRVGDTVMIITTHSGFDDISDILR